MDAHGSEGKRRDLNDKHVRFQIKDIYVPEPTEILVELHGQDSLHGRIIDLSDSGLQRDAFAVVEVEGLSRPVVVPVAKILEVQM
jgi:hypothetical protein